MVQAPHPLADIAYTEPVPDTTKGNLLDVHLPENPRGAGLPALIWTSGSAWLSDDGKVGAPPIAAEFNPRGYVVIGVSVRSSAQTRFPGQLHDIRAAIRFLRSNADEYHIDPNRIAIMGNSSGGWTAAMAAATSDRLRLDAEPDTGGVSSAVQAAVSFFPPVDFVAMDTQTAEQMAIYGITDGPVILHDDLDSPESLIVGAPIQEAPEAAAAASPLGYVDGSEPPTAIFHGTHDPLLPPGQSRSLYESMRDAGAEVHFTLVDGRGHEVMARPAHAPPSPFPTGDPVIGAPGFTMWSAEGGSETTGTGIAPTWDGIAGFLADALDDQG